MYQWGAESVCLGFDRIELLRHNLDLLLPGLMSHLLSVTKLSGSWGCVRESTLGLPEGPKRHSTISQLPKHGKLDLPLHKKDIVPVFKASAHTHATKMVK